MLGGAEVAQRRVFPDRENGGDEEAGIGEVAVPDGVDAAVQRVEAAGAEPRLDPSRAGPERAELAPRDDAVLPRSNGSNAGSGCSTLGGIITPKVEHPAGAPPLFAQFVPQRGPTYRKYT